MPSTLVVLHHDRALDLGSPTATRRGRELLKKLDIALGELKSGTGRVIQGASIWVNASEGCTYARGTGAFASSSGTVGFIVNGVTITVTWGTSDTASMTAAVAAINASTNALVQNLVVASNLISTITFSSVAAGTVVNVAGIPFTCMSAATSQPNEFYVGASDTAAATNLVTAINAHPYLKNLVHAASSSGVVTLYLMESSVPSGVANVIGSSNSTTAAVSSATFAAGAKCVFRATVPGRIGNITGVTASGTNVSVSATRLASGAGMNVAPVSQLEK